MPGQSFGTQLSIFTQKSLVPYLSVVLRINVYIYATITANFCVRGNCERKEHPYILHINLLYMYNMYDRIQTVRENAAEGCSLC